MASLFWSSGGVKFSTTVAEPNAAKHTPRSRAAAAAAAAAYLTDAIGIGGVYALNGLGVVLSFSSSRPAQQQLSSAVMNAVSITQQQLQVVNSCSLQVTQAQRYGPRLDQKLASLLKRVYVRLLTVVPYANKQGELQVSESGYVAEGTHFLFFARIAL
jgi:hypothetical protein